MHIKNDKVRYWLSLLSLVFMGGTIYLLPYIRYVFYDQMIGTMSITDTQLGLLSTVYACVVSISAIPGAFMSDRIDAKKTIVFSIISTTILTFIHAMFASSYTIALLVWAGMGITTSTAYWPSLIKYINNLGTADEAGNSFGTYYMINGFSGALGNALPLYFVTKWGYSAGMWCVGAITAIASIMVIFFLESEATKKARGEVMEGDDDNIKISDVKYVLKWPGFWLYFIMTMVTYQLYSNVSYFNPYLIDVLGIEPSSSSLVSVIRSYGAMILAPVGGFMADRVFKSSAKWFICGLSIVGLLYAGVLFLFGPQSNIMVVTIYTLIPSLIIMPVYSVTSSVIREVHFHPAMVGTAIGLTGVLPISDGLIPPMFGFFLDHFGNTGYTFIFGYLIGIAILGVVCSMLIIRLDKDCKAGKKVMLDK